MICGTSVAGTEAAVDDDHADDRQPQLAHSLAGVIVIGNERQRRRQPQDQCEKWLNSRASISHSGSRLAASAWFCRNQLYFRSVAHHQDKETKGFNASPSTVASSMVLPHHQIWQQFAILTATFTLY